MVLVGVVVDLVLVVATVVGLWYGSNLLVEGASALARRVGLSEVVIGLTVVAFGTSSPEFAVTIDAAIEGRGDIAVGNVVGSNIFNLGFVLGGVALVRVLPTTRSMVRRDGLFLIGATLLLLVVLRDLALSRIEGLAFVVLLAGYLVVLFRRGRVSTVREPAAAFDPWHAVRLFGGLALIVGSAHLLVSSAADLARLVGVSEWVIGVTVVAVGTSTPELATALTAALRGQEGLSAGSLIGSDLFNVLGVLGVAAMIRPVTVAPEAFVSLLWLVGTVVLVVALLWSGRELSRVEGAVLVALSVVRWAVNVVR